MDVHCFDGVQGSVLVELGIGLIACRYKASSIMLSISLKRTLDILLSCHLLPFA